MQKWNRSEAVKATQAAKIEKESFTNAGGERIIKVSKTKIKASANSITQFTAEKGGIDRNYYGKDGKQIKQISNNDHNHKAESGFGIHGEHAHDYSYDENGKLIRGKARELTDEERKNNDDII